jgi:hypothetical protein
MFLARRADAAEPAPEGPSPRDHLHDGFHVRLIGGFGFTSFSGAGSSGRLAAVGEGPANTLLVGATPWPGVIVGGGVHTSSPLGHFRGGTSVFADTATAGPFVEWYPDPTRGWHIGALAGAGLVQLQAQASSETSGVLGVMAIAGYDWWISPEWSLGFSATAAASTDGSPLDTPSSGARYRITPLSAGLEFGIAFH